MKFSTGIKFALAIIGVGTSLAGVSATIASVHAKNAVIVDDSKQAVLPAQKRREREEIKINPYTGGLDYNPYSFNMPGMSPKEYGLSIYHGNKRKRSNRLRFSHNSKLKRR